MARAHVAPELAAIEHPAILRALFGHMLDHAEIIGADHSGRPVLRIELALEPWLLDKLAAMGSSVAGLEEVAE